MDKKSIKDFDIAIGFEYRDLNLKKIADDFSDGAGQQYPHNNLNGDLNVYELFTEFYFPFITDTSLNFSLRFSDYSLEETAFTYDFGIIQKINENFNFKASHQRAIRMPDISDLFTPSGVNQTFLDIDPCSGLNPIKSLEECSRTGVTQALYGTISDTEAQINSLIGGNINLSPEKAITNSFSFLYSDHFDFELDFYSISLKDKISTPTASFILNRCLETGNNYYCDLIERNPTTGTFFEGTGKIETPLLNISSQNIIGFDLNVLKTFSFDFGELKLSNYFSYLYKNDIQLSSTVAKEECRGKYENTCGLPSPEIQNILSLSFIYKILNFDTSTSLSARYIDGVKDTNSLNPINFSSYSYLDMNFSIDFLKDLNLTLGINNIFDKNPPLNGKSINYVPGNANTYPSYYDPLGRYVFLNISKKFN